MNKLAIVVGGGPAPGINSVISAATIRAILEGIEVLGVRNGFEFLMQENVEHVRPLSIDDVSRIHFRGGSMLGTSRANPTKDAGLLEATVRSLEHLGVSRLITIGGDDTAFSAMKVAERAGDRLRVVHVPKTIDNDLDLPPHVDTFGFQTACHHGVGLVQSLMVDAETTGRWYFVVAMGRKAGHLALGIGKGAAATLTLIPEEFGAGPVRLATVVDTLVGAVLKRLAAGRRDGVAVIAEGVALLLDPADLSALEHVERDEHGHVRLAEIALGDLLRHEVQARLRSLGVKTTLVAHDIGYELRCMDPIPYDMSYCRDLGYCAIKFLLGGGNGAMISLQGGHFVPIPFPQLVDPATGRTRVREVDITSTHYAIARRFMIRLRRDDFDDAEHLAAIAAAAGLSVADFRARFEHLVATEPPPLVL
ncbi:MAG TPA: diphosphate--fructose-6-phosphate 1-phosphotransferase [Candidatus Binatia bacterium]